jgi:hypothetical protein
MSDHFGGRLLWGQVWSTKQAAPALAIDLRANVCCCKYSPGSAHHVAVGCADHNVHLYDLRAPDKALHIFGGALSTSFAPCSHAQGFSLLHMSADASCRPCVFPSNEAALHAA